MFALVGSTVLSIAQVGVTVGIGLLLDTLIVRTFLMPSLVALLGRWFWWPYLIGNRFTPRAQPGGPPRSQTSANSATRRVRSDMST
jgi:putative drug exporter of the RND superfamily